MRAEPADAAFLDRHADLVAAQRLADQFLVERLGEAQVDHARRQPAPFERVGGLERLRQSRAEREDRDGLAAAHDTPLADRQLRSEEHTSELQSLMRISYAVFRLKNKNKHT